MFTVTVNKEKVGVSASGERTIVLAEALSCVDACRNFLMKHMDLSKEEAIRILVDSMTE